MLVIDPSIPLADQTKNLTEDLLQVAYPNGVILDVGWYPELCPDGQFWVSVILDDDWTKPRYDQSCTEYHQLLKLISIGAKVAEWLGEGTDLQALDALLELDGQEKTLTCLEAPNGAALMIAGGNDGRYLVNLLLDPETQQGHVLTDPAETGADVELCCGGQTAEYPAHWCVNLRLVLDAAHQFVAHGEMSPHLLWKKT